MEERLIDLEIRITRQEDMIDELNKTVYQQQLKIDGFEAILKEMARRIIELESDKPRRYPGKNSNAFSRADGSFRWKIMSI